MLQFDMCAVVRKDTGKGAMRRLRKAGNTPAVVYGDGKEALLLQMETKSLFNELLVISRTNAILTLKVEGSVDKHVTAKEIQTDPVTDNLIHVDFCEIDLEKSSLFHVPIKFEGVAKGVEMGGILSTHSMTVAIEGKPLDIPDEIPLDISGLEIGQRLDFSELVIPAIVSMVSDPSAPCVSVVQKGLEVEEMEEELEGEEGAEAAAAEGEGAAEEKAEE